MRCLVGSLTLRGISESSSWAFVGCSSVSRTFFTYLGLNSFLGFDARFGFPDFPGRFVTLLRPDFLAMPSAALSSY